MLVRLSLFDLIDTQRPSTSEVPDFVAALVDHPYAVWFREFELRRFFPWVLNDAEAVRHTFTRRVGQAVNTFTSVDLKRLLPATRIIILTWLATSESSARDAGADDFLLKDVHPQTLLDHILWSAPDMSAVKASRPCR